MNPKRLAFFTISAFFYAYFSIVGVYVVYMPKVMQILGYSPMQIGFIFAMPPLIRFLLPFFFLKHIKLDNRLFHRALVLMLLSAFSFYFTIENFWLFIIPNLLIGATMGLVLPYVETYALDELKKERFGRSRLFGSIGFMLIGILLARMLEDPFMGVHFFVICVTFTTFFAYLAINKKRAVPVAQKKQDESTKGFNLKALTFVWISLFFMQMSFAPFYNFFTIYETDHGISLEMTSYLWSFGVICEIIFFYFQGPLLQKNLFRLLQFSISTTVVRWFLLYAFADSLLVSFLSQSMHAISFALHHTAAIALLHSVYKNRALATQFYYGFSFGLGGFIGAIVAGYFYGPYLYLYASGIALLSLLALFMHKSSNELKQNL